MSDATATVEAVDEGDAAPTVAAPAPAKRPAKKSRTRVIEIDEEIHEHRDTIAVRLAPGERPYSIWDCPESPGEKIRISSGEVMRFRNGNLECRDADDDALVEQANVYAGGKYLRADPKYLDDPFIYECKGRFTRWHSKRAYERYVALHPNET